MCTLSSILFLKSLHPFYACLDSVMSDVQNLAHCTPPLSQSNLTILWNAEKNRKSHRFNEGFAQNNHSRSSSFTVYVAPFLEISPMGYVYTSPVNSIQNLIFAPEFLSPEDDYDILKIILIFAFLYCVNSCFWFTQPVQYVCSIMYLYPSVNFWRVRLLVPCGALNGWPKRVFSGSKKTYWGSLLLIVWVVIFRARVYFRVNVPCTCNPSLPHNLTPTKSMRTYLVEAPNVFRHLPHVTVGSVAPFFSIICVGKGLSKAFLTQLSWSCF